MTKESKTRLMAPEKQAKHFNQVRKARRNEIVEDYVELIADLLEVNQEARLSDLSQRFGVSHASASKVLNKLKTEGYIISEPYRSIFLTNKGKALAKKSKERHQIIVNFLLQLGISKEIAEMDAEGIEHHVSGETLDAFAHFVGQC